MQNLIRKPYKFCSASVIPRKIGVLGYGAIGKAFTSILFKNHPSIYQLNVDANVVVVDMLDEVKGKEVPFTFIHHKVTRENVHQTKDIMGLKEGDFLLDLSTNIDCRSIWGHCSSNQINYLNTALEIWEDEDAAVSYPKNAEEAYQLTLGYQRNLLSAHKLWNTKEGPTAVFDMGFNPGMVSNCVKRGIEDIARTYLQRGQKGINLELLKTYLHSKNHSKLAQVLGVHTIHCSELDTQTLEKPPADYLTKLYNTWSCRGFLTEGMVPIQVARGSHEDKTIDGMWTFDEDSLIVNDKPSVQTWAKSWVPNQDIKGVLIPHGEAYSIREYLSDKETGYAPSQYYVYSYNKYAKAFVDNLPPTANIQNTNPETEVIHPMNHPSIRGVDKVGAMILMNDNRGWWTGSIMDDVDTQSLFNGKYGPTVLQVASSVYAGFLWGSKNPKKGCRYPEFLDTEFIIEKALPLLGRFVSQEVDLTQTALKDCHKLQSFITEAPQVQKSQPQEITIQERAQSSCQKSMGLNKTL